MKIPNVMTTIQTAATQFINTFQISAKIDKRIDFHQKKIYFVYAPMQAGKTRAIIEIMAKAYEKKLNCLLLTRSFLTDQKQFLSRVEKHNTDHPLFDVGEVDAISSLKPYNIRRRFERSPHGDANRHPGMHMVSLGNAPQLKALYQALQDQNMTPNNSCGVLLVDEADLLGLDLSSNITKLTAVENDLQKLRPYFHTIVMVSATPYATIFTGGANCITDMITLDVPANYFGVNSFDHQATDIYPKQGRGYSPALDAKNLHTVMNGFLSYKPGGRLLINVSQNTDDHNNISGYLMALYPKVTFVEFNKSKANILNNFNGTTGYDSINDAIQALKDEHASTGKHHHIVIISGKMAARGISFVSTDYKWHLTHQYYVPAKSTNMDIIMQNLRLCGCYPEPNIAKPVLYCDVDTFRMIQATDKEYKLVTDKMETAGTAHEVFCLPQYIERQHMAQRKRKASVYQLNDGSESMYDSETDFKASKHGNVPLLTKLIPATAFDPIIQNLMDTKKHEIVSDPNNRSSVGRGYNSGFVSNRSSVIRDAIYADCQIQSVAVSLDLVGEFKINRPDYMSRFDGAVQGDCIYHDPVSSKAQWKFVFDLNGHIPYHVIVRSDKADTKAQQLALAQNDYAFHDKWGGITVVHASQKNPTLKRKKPAASANNQTITITNRVGSGIVKATKPAPQVINNGMFVFSDPAAKLV